MDRHCLLNQLVALQECRLALRKASLTTADRIDKRVQAIDEFIEDQIRGLIVELGQEA